MSLKFSKLPLITATFAVISAPLLISLPAYAAVDNYIDFPPMPPAHLVCDDGNQVDEMPYTTSGCDLFIDEQVSVNSGTNVEAPTAGQAVQAKIGDTVTWTVTVDNGDVASNNLPDGTVTVTDALPSQVTFVSATTSTQSLDASENYDTSNNTWTFDVADVIPATLTIVAKVNATGVFTNNVALADYTPPCGYTGSCLDPAYTDNNTANNAASGYVNVQAPTTATTTTVTTPSAKAPNTGFGVNGQNAWLSLISGLLIALPLVGIGYKLRQTTRQQ